MSEEDKNWKPPTLDSSIEYMEYEISKNPFGVPAFEGFILQTLKELKGDRTTLLAKLQKLPELLGCFAPVSEFAIARQPNHRLNVLGAKLSLLRSPK